MKRPHIGDRTVKIYVDYLEAKADKYKHEKEKAELYLALKKEVEGITKAIINQPAVEENKNGKYVVNKDMLDLIKDVTKITKQLDELKEGLDKDVLKKAEQSMQLKTSIKGKHSPEEMADKFRKSKLKDAG